VGDATAAIQRQAPHISPARAGALAQEAVLRHRERPTTIDRSAVYRSAVANGMEPEAALRAASQLKPHVERTAPTVISIGKLAAAIQRQKGCTAHEAMRLAKGVSDKGGSQ
jgi:hypothetical protein